MCAVVGGNCGEIQVRGEIQPQHIFSLRAEANRIYITDWEARTLSLIILSQYLQHIAMPVSINV